MRLQCRESYSSKLNTFMSNMSKINSMNRIPYGNSTFQFLGSKGSLVMAIYTHNVNNFQNISNTTQMYSGVLYTRILMVIIKISMSYLKYIVYQKYINMYGYVNLGCIHALFLTVCWTVCSGSHQIKHKSTELLALGEGIRWWDVGSLHKGSVKRFHLRIPS